MTSSLSALLASVVPGVPIRTAANSDTSDFDAALLGAMGAVAGAVPMAVIAATAAPEQISSPASGEESAVPPIAALALAQVSMPAGWPDAFAAEVPEASAGAVDAAGAAPALEGSESATPDSAEPAVSRSVEKSLPAAVIPGPVPSMASAVSTPAVQSETEVLATSPTAATSPPVATAPMAAAAMILPNSAGYAAPHGAAPVAPSSVPVLTSAETQPVPTTQAFGTSPAVAAALQAAPVPAVARASASVAAERMATNPKLAGPLSGAIPVPTAAVPAVIPPTVIASPVIASTVIPAAIPPASTPVADQAATGPGVQDVLATPADTKAGSAVAAAREQGADPVPIALPVLAAPTQTPASALVAPASAAPAAAPAPPTFAAQVSAPIFTLVGGAPGEHTLTVNVAPENLGPVTVRAHITADGIRIQLFAPTDAGRDALRAILPDLRRDLAGSGLESSLDLSSRNEPDDSRGDNGRRDRRSHAVLGTTDRGRAEALGERLPYARNYITASTIDVTV